MNRVLRTESRIDNELILLDPLFERIIGSCDPIEIELSSDYFSSLASSIVGQQLSNKVADVIWNRVVSLMEGELSPEKLLSIEDIEFRTIGISYAKIGYLKNLARAVIDNKIRLDDLEGMENTAIIETLTAVKGIGQWTAEMFLIFSLGREDVFSLGDGGLQRSVKWLYQLSEDPTKSQLMKISERWKPYRTYASLYLWQAINKKLISNLQ